MYFFISPKWISVSSVHTRRVHVRTVFTACKHGWLWLVASVWVMLRRGLLW